MVIIKKSTITQYGINHAEVAQALDDWYEIVSQMNWATLHDIKRTFNSVDYVGDNRYVFNIKGNKYRLIAMIFFDIRTVFIRFIGTHAEYDKVIASKI